MGVVVCIVAKEASAGDRCSRWQPTNQVIPTQPKWRKSRLEKALDYFSPHLPVGLYRRCTRWQQPIA